MASGPDPACSVCVSLKRYQVEQSYLEGRRIPDFSRGEVERHMAHAFDPAAVRLLTGLAGSTGIASRLRALEVNAVGIMDAALSEQIVRLPDGTEVRTPPDAKLALAAMKEARAILHEMSALTGALESGHGADGSDRPDLDAALGRYLNVDEADVSSTSTREADGSPRSLDAGSSQE